MLTYQNASEIINDFIVEKNEHFPRLKEHFKRNPQVYQNIYAPRFLKYFCWVDNYGMKSKIAFDVAFGGYKNKEENIHFIREMLIKQEVVETSQVVEMCPPTPLPPTPAPEVAEKECKPPKKSKGKC